MKTSTEGYKHNSPDNKEPSVIIPSNQISMSDTIHDQIYAIPYKNGKPQQAVLMKRGGEYDFKDADYVVEIPQMQTGGGVQYSQNMFGNTMPFLYGNEQQQPQYQPTPNYFSPQDNYGSVYSLDENGNPVSIPSTGVMDQYQTYQNQQATGILNQNQSLVPPNGEENPANQNLTTPTDLDEQHRYDQSFKDAAWAKNLPQDNITQNYDTNLKNDYESWIGSQEMDGSSVIPEHNVPNPNQSQLYNPYSSYDTSSAAFTLGNAIGGGTPAYRGGLAGGKLALSLGRDITSGIGNGKRKKFLDQEYAQKQRDGLTGLQEGGMFSYEKGLQSPSKFMQDGGNISLPQSLTGEYVEGQPENKENQTVVELEKGEHVLQPDGTTSEVVGDKHSQGGEKLTAQQIQEGSIVISDHLKVGKENAKYFKEKYDIKVKAKDTYATVIDKVKDKIGITKNTKEQEDAFKQLEKEEKNTKDTNTKNLNREFLSSKINELEQEKQQLEPARLEAMKEVYEKQEASKPKENPTNVDPQIMAQVAQQNNISPEQAQQAVEQFMKGGEYKKMQNGGPLNKQNIQEINQATGITFDETGANALFGINQQSKQVQNNDPLNYDWYKDEGYINVARNGDNYTINPTQKNPYNYVDYVKMVDKIKSLNPDTNIVGNYTPMKNRPKYQEGGPLTQNDVNSINQSTGITFDQETANRLFGVKEKLSPQQEDPLNYGWYKDEGYIDVSRNGDSYIINPTQKNPYNYVDYVKMVDKIKAMNPNSNVASNYIPMENRGGYQDGGNVQYSDPTAVESLEKLKKKYPKQFAEAFDTKTIDGKTVYSQKSGYDPSTSTVYFEKDLGKISADERQRATPVNSTQPLGPIVGQGGLEGREGIAETQKTDTPLDGVANTTGAETKEQAGNALQNLPLLPNQTVLPPSSMQPPLKVENRLQQIDSVNISPEQQLAENQRQAKAFQSMIKDLPPNQQAAMMAQILSQTQNANNQAIGTTNTQNAQIDAQTQNYNAQIADRENILAGQNAKDYEGKVFQTQALYEENLNQYYDYNRLVNTQNFNDVRNQNTVNQMFENYNLDANGNIVMTPQQFQLYANNGSAIVAPKDTKKKK